VVPAAGPLERDTLPPLTEELIITISQRYQRVYEMLTGEAFSAASYPAHKRIVVALHYANVLG